MTKKDYVLIAGVLKSNCIFLKSDSRSDELARVEQITMDLADKFEEENPSFDREKFYQACGFGAV